MKLKTIILYILNLNLNFFSLIELKKFNLFYFLLFYIKDINKIFLLFFFFKKNSFLKATILSDICIIDYPSRLCRFEIVYNVLSVFYNTRFFFKFFLKETDYVLSLTSLFSSGG